jgi:hypothetical protein
MKKLFFYIITIITLLTVAGAKGFCQSVMTMTTAPSTLKVNIGLLGSGKATIDWGDGKNEKIAKLCNLAEYPYFVYYHTYSDTLAHTITIIGKDILVLYCENNQLINLDISKNEKIISLFCNKNNLTNLDVSKNIELKSLDCKNNQLKNLNISKNTKLTSLFCRENYLTNLNVCENTVLYLLDCGYNQLTNLDLSKNIELEILRCENNNFSETALNEMFKTICVYNKTNALGSEIDIFGNSGADSCDKSIVENKGWYIFKKNLDKK